MDVYDVVGSWNTIFSMLSLIRVGKENGKIVIYDNKEKATWTILSYILVSMLCVIPLAVIEYIDFGAIPIGSNFLYTVIATVQIPLFVILAATESYTNIKEYYENYQLIEKALIIKSYTYENQKRTFNNYFVMFSVLTIVSVFADVTSWLFIYEVSYSIRHAPYLISQCFIYLQYWVTILNLKIFREYLSMVLERAMERLQTAKSENMCTTVVSPYLISDCSDLRSDSTFFKDMKQLTECYMLLGDQCCILNNKHGIQLVIIFTSTAIHLTILCQVMIQDYGNIYSASFSVWISFLNKFLRVLHETTLLMLLLRESVIVQRLRSLLLSALDRALISNNLGPRDEDSVVEFGTILQRQSLMFTANDYFNLDYSVFHNILTVLITYTVILAQVN